MLYVLKNSKSKLRKNILKEVDPEIIKTLCEVCINTLNGNVKIPIKILNYLKKYKRAMRHLSFSKTNIPAKRNILIQRGGFLPVLLGALLSSVVGQLIEKKL